VLQPQRSCRSHRNRHPTQHATHANLATRTQARPVPRQPA
jgi:hypothetical protein